MKQFSMCVEEALFRLSVHRDRALNYKTEEVQITAVDELYVEQDKDGHIDKQIARVRLFFLGFLAGKGIVKNTDGVSDMGFIWVCEFVHSATKYTMNGLR